MGPRNARARPARVLRRLSWPTALLLAGSTAMVAAAAAMLLSVHSGADGPWGTSGSHRLVGNFTLWRPTPAADPCQTPSVAPDIHAGAPVEVHNETGVTVGTATLSTGEPDPTRRGCVYHFTVERLPASDSYTFQIGARLGLTYPRNEVAQAGWQVALNLDVPMPIPTPGTTS
jgi:hypothetical protein